MHATTSERRAPALARMPVTMSVELGHDGWDETYEADAVNLSSGGIGVRAPMLPDVGQRLRCRFRVPELDAPCEAEGEVVWASDAGDAGEFGIRFDTLDPVVGEVLARWVSTLEGGERPGTEPGLVPHGARRPSVKVQLDGVASPIEAEVSVSDGRRVRVEQPLPFLLLGTKATLSADGEGSGVRRVLRSVELKIDGAVPRLVLELEQTASEATPVESPEAPTLADQPLEALLAAREAPAAEAPSVQTAPPVMEPERPARVWRQKRRDDSPRAVRIERDPLAELGVSPPSVDEDEAEDSLGARLREVGEHVRPSFTRMVMALHSGWAALIAGAGPKARALEAWVAKLARSIRDELAARWPALKERLAGLRPGGAPKRRATTAPPELETDRKTSQARRALAPESAPSRPKVPLRFVLAGAVVLVATALVVRALGGQGEEPAPVAHEPTLAITEPEEAAPSEPAVAPPVALEPPVLAAAPVEAAAPTLPGTLGASSTEAGRLGAPTFPRVGEGAASEPSDTTGAEAEPEALPRPTGRLTFGAADVPHGRSTTLTMTLPIGSIEGEATETGFTVNLPGVNSLSRAAPIAAANPSVERAAILNSGDHAVLTVRFVPGRTPPYRVEARGRDLIVTIGR